MAKLSNTSAGGGIGFGSILALIFITLKLTDHIDWSWLWVLSPIWIPLAVAAVLLVFAGLFALIAKIGT